LPTVQTTRFGEVTYQDNAIIRFIKPILGFNQLSQYIVIARPESEPFKWLQSIEDPDVCFVVVDPRLIIDKYDVEVSQHDIKMLDGSDDQIDYQLYVIVTVPRGHPELMSVNLQGPIVIYVKRLTALQMVLNNPDYEIRHSLFQPQTA